MHTTPPSHPHAMFVYGTLQRGQNNYPYWLADAAEAIFVGTAQTVHRYPFFVNLLPDHDSCSPCVLNAPDSTAALCEHVSGELFLVSDRMLAWLDVLEDVAHGVYVATPIDVQLIALPHSLQSSAKWSDCVWPLLQPHATSASNGGSTAGTVMNIRALIYFRNKGYPDDWHHPIPRSSSKLLKTFSSAEMLSAHGARFNGVPAHLNDHATALRMQAALETLPAAYRPPPSAPCGAPLRPKPMVLFIIDGIGDNTYAELGNRTPLEVVAGVPPRHSPAVESIGLPVPYPTLDLPPSMDLDAFTTPGINVVTEAGVSGYMDPFQAGMSCGSDTAHLSMLGYPPQQYYRGRGAYEALGAGLRLGDEDIAFKSNFATFADPSEGGYGDEDPETESLAVKDGLYITHRRCDRDFTTEGPALCAALHGTVITEDLTGRPFEIPHVIHVQYATEHRCGVSLTGATREPVTGEVQGMLSDKITGTDCLKDGRLLKRCAPTVPAGHPEYEAARYTSRLVEVASARITQILKVHPINESRRAHNRRAADAGTARKNVANVVLFRGAAKKGWVPSFAVRHGLRGLVVAPTCIIKGLALCCSLEDTICEQCYVSSAEALRGATGDVHSDLDVKVDAALHALGLTPHTKDVASTNTSGAPHPDYNFVLLHIKGVDDAGHNASLCEKLQVLQRCGAALQRLWERLSPGSTVAVVADHSTPIAVGDHCCEPVPVSMAVKPAFGSAASGPVRDGVQHYSEILAVSGALGRFRGEALIPTMKRLHAHYHYE